MRKSTIKRSLEGLYFTMILNVGEANEQTFEIPYANIVNFEYKRSVNNEGNTFKLTLLGPLSLEFEYRVLSSKDHKVTFVYGNSMSESRGFTGQVTSCDIKFEDMNIALNIAGTASVMIADRSNRTCVWKKGIYLDKIIDLICTAHGWGKGLIARAKPLSKNLTQTNQSDTEFLTDVLAPALVSVDGIGDYKLWFTYKGNRTILNYAPLQYCEDSGSDFVYDVLATTNSPLLSFSVSNMGTNAYSYGSVVGEAIVNNTTGKLEYNNSNEVAKSVSKLAQRAGIKYGLREAFINPASSMISSKATSANAVSYYWNSMYAIAYEADAEFLGDVFLDAGTVITVIVMLSGGKAHYSSGFYTVSEVTDTISSSGFLTKAKLYKTLGNVTGSSTI